MKNNPLRIALLVCGFLLCTGFAQHQPQAKVFFVPANGANLYVRTIGKGQPLLLLHGGPGFNHHYFLPALDELAGKYQLIYFDQRGCGRSADSVPDTSITLQNYINDIEAIRNFMGLKKIALLGHSFGGMLAVRYALAHPENLNKLILVNSVPLNKKYEQEANRLAKLNYTEKDTAERNTILRSKEFASGDAASYEKLFKIIFRSSFYNPALAEKVNLNLEKDFALHFRKVYNLSKDMEAATDLYPELGKIKCPVLVVYGRQDAIPLQSYRDIQTYCPQAVLKEFDQCGHFAFIEQPKLFMKVVKKF